MRVDANYMSLTNRDVTNAFATFLRAQCIVVSQETVRGAHKINEIRKEKSMQQLDVVIVDLVSECCKQSKHEEDKVSSSTLRLRKLGTKVHEVCFSVPQICAHTHTQMYIA